MAAWEEQAARYLRAYRFNIETATLIEGVDFVAWQTPKAPSGPPPSHLMPSQAKAAPQAKQGGSSGSGLVPRARP
eukprot:5386473-Prorocentrum_lima.AAC.1